MSTDTHLIPSSHINRQNYNTDFLKRLHTNLFLPHSNFLVSIVYCLCVVMTESTSLITFISNYIVSINVIRCVKIIEIHILLKWLKFKPTKQHRTCDRGELPRVSYNIWLFLSVCWCIFQQRGEWKEKLRKFTLGFHRLCLSLRFYLDSTQLDNWSKGLKKYGRPKELRKS